MWEASLFYQLKLWFENKLGLSLAELTDWKVVWAARVKREIGWGESEGRSILSDFTTKWLNGRFYTRDA